MLLAQQRTRVSPLVPGQATVLVEVFETPEIPAEFRVLSVVTPTHHVVQKRISGEDFSISKTAVGVGTASGKNAKTAHQESKRDQRPARTANR